MTRLRRQRGAAAVEFSLVFMLLLMIALGSFEWGMAFRDSLAVSSSVREGARVGSAAGTNAQADCLILEGASGALFSIAGLQVQELWIYKSDTTGAVGVRNRYRIAGPNEPLVCGVWFRIENGWPPGSGRVNTGTNRDWLGVRIIYNHQWKTGFLWWSGASTWQDSSVMRLEPSLPLNAN
jgi:hypothetical protein